MTGLRKEDGVSLDFIENKFGSHFREVLEKEVEENFIEKDFMELTLDEMHKKVVVDKTAFINFDEYDDQGGKEEKCEDKEMQRNDDHEE